MTCLDNAGAVWGPGQLYQMDTNNPAGVYTEGFMVDLVNLLLGPMYNFSCADAKAFIADNYLPQFLGGSVIRNGTTVPAINSGMISVEGTGAAGYMQSDNATAGTWVFGSEGFEITSSPQVAGQDFLSNFFIVKNVGDPTLFSVPISQILQSFNYDVWFCCASAAFNCCGAPAASKSGFLIPRPETPGVGEENISTPPFELPLYLSNYTAQFTNNFGRVKKV